MDLIAPFCGCPWLLSARPRHFNSLPDVVFLDLGALPSGPGFDKYWEGWRTTHVFFCLGVDTDDIGTPGVLAPPQCPQGWSSWLVTISHCEAGGATSSRWKVVAWYPPLMLFSEPLPVVPQSWFPLFSYVRDRERATPHFSPPNGGVAVAQVVRVDGLVQDWGLFLASELSATVLVQCSSSSSGYGSRRLTGAELGALWDLPISVLDALPGLGAEAVLQGFFRSAPTKILFSGAELTSSFRGGLGGLKTSALPTVGPRPLSNSALGLSPTSTLNHLLFHPVEVVKGDSQKADNTAVLDQLWLQAFLVGYSNLVCLARHHLALGLGNGMTGGEGPPPGWQAAMPGFRELGLRFWRRRALQGYYSWRQSNIQSNIPFQSNLPTPAQMVWCRMGMVFGGVRPM